VWSSSTPTPQVVVNPQLFRNPFNATREILVAVKAALKAVPKAKDAESREITPAQEVAASSTANVEKMLMSIIMFMRILLAL
jgi:hypothetical protein